MTPSPSGTGWTANENIKCKWQERFSELDHLLYIKNSIIKKRSKLDFEQNKEWWLATYQRCQSPPLSEFPQPPSPLPIGQKQTAQKHNPNTKNRTAVIRDFLTYGNSKRCSISAHIYTFIKHIHTPKGVSQNSGRAWREQWLCVSLRGHFARRSNHQNNSWRKVYTSTPCSSPSRSSRHPPPLAWVPLKEEEGSDHSIEKERLVFSFLYLNIHIVPHQVGWSFQTLPTHWLGEVQGWSPGCWRAFLPSPWSQGVRTQLRLQLKQWYNVNQKTLDMSHHS